MIMEILIFFINKLFMFLFILAALFLGQEVFRFVRGLNTGEYNLSNKRLLWLGIALSFIVTILITGFKV